MLIWFNKKVKGKKRYCSKSISFYFRPQHWKLIQWKNNGALKGIKEDRCYDLNIYFLGLFFSYTNYDYNSELNLTKLEIRKRKLLKLKKNDG